MDEPTDIERLVALRDRLLKEMDALRNKVAGLDIAIEIVCDEALEPA